MIDKMLFRGKEDSIGAWVYGSLVQDEIQCGIIKMGDLNLNASAYWKVFSIDRKTTGVWTRKNDKNGTKIFSDDIVEKETSEDGKTIKKRFCIKWTDEGFIAEPNVFACPLWVVLKRCTSFLEVVGNIYDNPELLKENNNGSN